jgi:uncharacterized membrane protein
MLSSSLSNEYVYTTSNTLKESCRRIDKIDELVGNRAQASKIVLCLPCISDFSRKVERMHKEAYLFRKAYHSSVLHSALPAIESENVRSEIVFLQREIDEFDQKLSKKAETESQQKRLINELIILKHECMTKITAAEFKLNGCFESLDTIFLQLQSAEKELVYIKSSNRDEQKSKGQFCKALNGTFVTKEAPLLRCNQASSHAHGYLWAWLSTKLLAFRNRVKLSTVIYLTAPKRLFYVGGDTKINNQQLFPVVLSVCLQPLSNRVIVQLEVGKHKEESGTKRADENVANNVSIVCQELVHSTKNVENSKLSMEFTCGILCIAVAVTCTQLEALSTTSTKNISIDAKDFLVYIEEVVPKLMSCYLHGRLRILACGVVLGLNLSIAEFEQFFKNIATSGKEGTGMKFNDGLKTEINASISNNEMTESGWRCLLQATNALINHKRTYAPTSELGLKTEETSLSLFGLLCEFELIIGAEPQFCNVVNYSTKNENHCDDMLLVMRNLMEDLTCTMLSVIPP